jgi:hypothetical protein
LAFVSLCVLFVGSLNLVVKLSYEIFFIVHLVTVAIFIGGELNTRRRASYDLDSILRA